MAGDVHLDRAAGTLQELLKDVRRIDEALALASASRTGSAVPSSHSSCCGTPRCESSVSFVCSPGTAGVPVASVALPHHAEDRNQELTGSTTIEADLFDVSASDSSPPEQLPEAASACFYSWCEPGASFGAGSELAIGLASAGDLSPTRLLSTLEKIVGVDCSAPALSPTRLKKVKNQLQQIAGQLTSLAQQLQGGEEEEEEEERVTESAAAAVEEGLLPQELAAGEQQQQQQQLDPGALATYESINIEIDSLVAICDGSRRRERSSEAAAVPAPDFDDSCLELEALRRRQQLDGRELSLQAKLQDLQVREEALARRSLDCERRESEMDARLQELRTREAAMEAKEKEAVEAPVTCCSTRPSSATTTKASSRLSARTRPSSPETKARRGAH